MSISFAAGQVLCSPTVGGVADEPLPVCRPACHRVRVTSRTPETSPTARALRTLEILQNRPGVTAAELARRLGVARVVRLIGPRLQEPVRGVELTEISGLGETRAEIAAQHAVATPRHLLETRVGGDPEQPGPHRAAPLEAVPAAPRANESLLQRVLGVVRRAQHPVAVRPQFPAVVFGQFGEGGLIGDVHTRADDATAAHSSAGPDPGQDRGVPHDLVTTLRRGVRGVVHDSPRRRAEYSSDASNYRIVPQAVVEPVDADDVAAVLDVSRSHGAAVTCRGAGTSIAGNAVGAGIVLDLSRHFTRVVEVGVAAGRISVTVAPDGSAAWAAATC